MLLATLRRPKKQANAKLRELIRQGYYRRWTAGELVRMAAGDRWLKALDPLRLVLGRFRSGEATARLAAAIEEAYQLTGGSVEAVGPDGTEVHYGRGLLCTVCGATATKPVPALFSFNSPLGACPVCQGFGRVTGIDPDRVIPNPALSLAEHPIAPWNTPAYRRRYLALFAACRERGVPLNVPWQELDERHREWIWNGKGRFTSIRKFFNQVERRNYKVHMRVLLARYRAYNRCPECEGGRLQPAARAVRLKKKTLPELVAMSVEGLRAWLAEVRWTRRQRAAAGHLIDQLNERVETLHRVGLDYLTLDRASRTLSGGEAQRIQLAAALGSGLTSTVYVLDEPTIGLHPQDSERLLALLRDLAARGNTVLVVEHDRTLIRGADWVIDLGPLAGELGGEVIAEGPPAAIMDCRESLTGAFLRHRPDGAGRRHGARYRREHGLPEPSELVADQPRVRIRGATAHNLRAVDVDLPLGALVVVTGVSGSGKSTLVENVLYGNHQRSRGVVDVEPGECRELSGLDDLAELVLVDQRPIGRSTRSNPVTYVKAYDEIRKLFAATPAARRRYVQPGHFSFNRDWGRCPECEGTGVTEVDMHFMAPVTVTCDRCQGRRFKPEVLGVVLRGRNIAETLELTVKEAMEVFADRQGLCRRLEALFEVGLGYLRLGQPTSTLSGGEAQRLKLATFLNRPAGEGRRLFLFDEPTTGLHMADVDLLCRTLRHLVDQGHGVVVVEHNLDLIARADWIVDLGPGGGTHGGRLLYSGPVEPFLDGVGSPTAEELRKHLGWGGVGRR